MTNANNTVSYTRVEQALDEKWAVDYFNSEDQLLGSNIYANEIAARQAAAQEAEGESDYDESMDGDFDSAMASAGFGTDEDYGYYGNDGDE